MATELLAVGTSDLESDEVVLADGAAANFCLMNGGLPIPANTVVYVVLKGPGSNSQVIDALHKDKVGAQALGPGTFILTRPPGVACGAFSG